MTDAGFEPKRAAALSRINALREQHGEKLMTEDEYAEWSTDYNRRDDEEIADMRRIKPSLDKILGLRFGR